jgi:hypothetical protein
MHGLSRVRIERVVREKKLTRKGKRKIQVFSFASRSSSAVSIDEHTFFLAEVDSFGHEKEVEYMPEEYKELLFSCVPEAFVDLP